MSDDIPIIFAQDIVDPQMTRARSAVFLSAEGAAQMQQYAVAGWTVAVAPGFESKGEVALSDVPAATPSEEEIATCTLLSCEAPYLKPETSNRISGWKPEIVKINCAFHDVSDASSLITPLKASGYTVLGAIWRDDNSFLIRSLMSVDYIDAIQLPEWDRINLIGVRDADHAKRIVTIARLYSGEEKRISELRVAKAIRDDYIAKLEDALMTHQKTEIFKERPS